MPPEVAKARRVRCRCGREVRVFQETYEFYLTFSRDGEVIRRVWTAEPDPDVTGVWAVCQCGRVWKMRKVAQITGLGRPVLGVDEAEE